MSHAIHVCFLVVTGRPSAPEGLKVTKVSDNSVTLKWSAPARDGGCPVKGYVVEKRDTFKRVYTQVGKTAMCEFRVPRLVAGNEYVFQVSAENDVGVGEAAELSQGVEAKSAFGKESQQYNTIHLLSG